jgi:hypothetical protein
MLTVLALGAGAGVVDAVGISSEGNGAAPDVSAAHAGAEDSNTQAITALIIQCDKNPEICNGKIPKNRG